MINNHKFIQLSVRYKNAELSELNICSYLYQQWDDKMLQMLFNH